MPILNYTTSISSEKTTAEIHRLLSMAGAQAIMNEYENGVITTISFRMITPHGAVFFKLPSRIQGVMKALKQDAPKRFQNIEQATRVSWRIVKDWVEAQLAMIKADQADTVELFLPFAQDDKGMTVYEKLQHTDFKMLTHQD